MCRNPWVNLTQERGVAGHDIQPDTWALVWEEHQQKPTAGKYIEQDPNELKNKKETLPSPHCPVYLVAGPERRNQIV